MWISMELRHEFVDKQELTTYSDKKIIKQLETQILRIFKTG